MIALPPELLGTIPGWITSASAVTGLGMYFRYLLGKGKLSIEGAAQRANDQADIRDHYAEEVRQLREKLDAQSQNFRTDLLDLEERYRKLLDESEARHEQCLADRDTLRERVNQLEDELRGLIRVITQASIDRVLMLNTDIPDDIREAAARVETLIKERGRE